ncbi:MAG: hypothetical protein U0930_23425 [Pirellulales bacterium]
MKHIHELESQIQILSLADQLAVRDRLDASINDLLRASNVVGDKADIALMEQRLVEYRAGQVESQSWEIALPEIQAELRI